MERLKCIRFQSYNLNISIGKSAGYKCLYRWRMRSSDWSSLSLSNWVDGVGIDLISWIKSGWNQNLIHTRIFPLTLIRKIEKSRLEKKITRYELGQILNYCLLELSFNAYNRGPLGKSRKQNPKIGLSPSHRVWIIIRVCHFVHAV